MLPVIDSDGRRAGREAVVYAAALLPTSLVPTFAGVSGIIYAVIAAVLGVATAGGALQVCRNVAATSPRGGCSSDRSSICRSSGS